MIRRAALLAAAVLICTACGGSDDAEPRAAPSKHLVYTRGLGLASQAIWIGDVEGRRMRRLTRGGFGLVSPDGETIAVSRPAGIVTVDAGGGGERFVARGRAAKWLPDSRHLLAMQAKTLVSIDLETGRVDVIERREVTSWSISPEGQSVAYDVDRARPPRGECGFDIYRALVDGSSKQRLTTGGRSSHPVWRQGSIAFAYRPAGSGCFKPRVWQMDPDGRNKTALMPTLPDRFASSGRYGVRPFGWVSGSPLLLATISTEWGAELALVDTRSGRTRVPDLDPRPRRRTPMYADHPSRDGRYVVGAACGAEFPCTIRIYSVDDGRGRELITGRVAYPHWNR